MLDDPEMLTWRAYGVHAWPTLVLIDPGGRVALQVSGEGRGSQIADAVETLLRAHEAAGDLVRGPLPHGRGAVPLHATGLRYPSKLAYDEQSGLLAISDTGHNRIVLLDYATRAVRSTIGTGARGAADGAFEVASFSSPQGVCFWQGSLWVADAGNHLLRKVDLERRNVETIPARLRSPWDVAPFGGLLTIAMAGSHQLWGYDIASGRFQALAGTGREGIVDGPAAQAELAQPSGLAASDRMLGFVDAETSSLRVVAPRPMGGFAIATVIGTGLFDWGTADGSSTDARMQHPQGLATVPGGWVVTDTFNHRLRRFSWETGQLTTLAGSTAGFADGIAAAARFDEPSGAVLVGDRVVVADTNNHALRSVDLATGAVDTLLPSGLAPPGTAPSLLAPATVAEGSEVEIEVTLHGPAGTRLDSSSGAPVRVHVSAEPSSLLAAPAEYSGDHCRRASPCARPPARGRCAWTCAARSATTTRRPGPRATWPRPPTSCR